MKRINTLLLLLFSLKVGAQTPTLVIADSLYTVGNYSEAIQHLENIQEPSVAIQLKKAKVYEATGNLNLAIENYKTVLQQNPDKVLSAIDYGSVLIKAGALESADSLYHRLASKYPENATFQFQRGIVKEKQNDSTYIDYFQNTIQLDPYHQQALYLLAKVELSKRNFSESEKLAQQGLEANPHNASLLSILAQTYFNENSYVLAIPPFEKLLELGKGNEFVHSKLGFCYYYQLSFNEAIKQYKLALTYEDKNSDTHYNLGKLYARIGDLEKSETHLLMSLLIKKQPVDAEFLSLALTYKLQENYEKAFYYFNSVLEENPENERALYERAIAADNFYKDKKAVLNYYNTYLSKYSKSGNKELIYLAKTRMKDLREELHLKGE